MPVTFDLKTWDGFSELSKEGLDFLLDTTAINKRLADKKNSPYRWRVGSFAVPVWLKGEGLKKACKESIDKWLNVFEKQGWTLASKVQIYPGQKYAYDLVTNVPILDRTEIRCRAIFKTDPKPLRIELPPSSVRQDPEQKSSLSEFIKGEGIKPVPIKQRIKGDGLKTVKIPRSVAG
jgi:hypothetical protein